jgi:hypothetical protein
MAACRFCHVELGAEPAVELSLQGEPRGLACADVMACRLRVVLGGLHDWPREDRDALRRISDVLSVLPEKERQEALSEMTRRLIDD